MTLSVVFCPCCSLALLAADSKTVPADFSATQIVDLPLRNADQLCWKEPTPTFDEIAARLDAARTEKPGPSVRRRPSASYQIHCQSAILVRI